MIEGLLDQLIPGTGGFAPYLIGIAIGFVVRMALSKSPVPLPNPLPNSPSVPPAGTHRPLVHVLAQMAGLPDEDLAALKGLLDRLNAPAPWGATAPPAKAPTST